MQSLSAARGSPRWGYWTSGPGVSGRSRHSGAAPDGWRVVPLALTQHWAWAAPAHRTWRTRRRGSWRGLGALFLAGALAYGLSIGGHLERLTAQLAAETGAMAQRAGFTVQRLTVEGQNRTHRDDIVAALALSPSQSMLSLDTSAAQARLEGLSWVRHAQIMRLLPSTLHIVIEERTPFAVWQLQGDFALVDAEGVVLGPLGREDPTGLPLVVGEGAGAAAPALLRALAAHADVRADMRAAIRVADRRWNLKLASGLEVRLPEDNVERALDRLAEFERTRRLPASDVLAVDLRLPDRVTLRLTEQAAARWSDAVARGQRGRDRSARDT